MAPNADSRRWGQCLRKRRYPAENDALARMIRLARRRVYMRVYSCPFCGGWHLTRQRA